MGASKIGKTPKKGNANEATAKGNNDNAKVVVNCQEPHKEPGTLSKISSSGSLVNQDTPSENEDKITVLENK